MPLPFKEYITMSANPSDIKVLLTKMRSIALASNPNDWEFSRDSWNIHEPFVTGKPSIDISVYQPVDDFEVLIEGDLTGEHIALNSPKNVLRVLDYIDELVPTQAKHRLYYSERGLPLIATQLRDQPILTLENYCKWYSAYLLHPNGSVTKIDAGEYDAVDRLCKFTPRIDHCFHPHFLELLAIHLGAVLCSQSEELAAGRWALEIDELYYVPLQEASNNAES